MNPQIVDRQFIVIVLGLGYFFIIKASGGNITSNNLPQHLVICQILPTAFLGKNIRGFDGFDRLPVWVRHPSFLSERANFLQRSRGFFQKSSSKDQKCFGVKLFGKNDREKMSRLDRQPKSVRNISHIIVTGEGIFVAAK